MAATRTRARQRFVQRLAQQIDERGTVDVIRHGVRDQNVEIRLSYRKPAFGVAPELVAHYDANRLTVTRQLPFDPESNKTLDLCLFVNGIPVATAELKNPLTGQNVEHAIEQYRDGPRPDERHSRSARARPLRRRSRAVAMTTKLAGEGDPVPAVQPRPRRRDGQPAEPQRPQDLVPVGAGLGRDAWLDILHRFIHVERPEKGSVGARRAAETVIFPRYHQWDAVRKLEADARGQRCRPDLPDPALGRVGQVEHDRLAGPPAVDPARRRGPQGLRQGRRDHRPRGPRPPAAGHDLPVRARPRRRREDRQGLQPARRGAGRRAGADHHHDAAEVPVRARQDRDAARRATTP